MGFEYRTLEDQEKEEPLEKITANKDLYLTGDKDAVVAEGPDASFLLARRGRQVPAEYTDLVTAKGNPRKRQVTKEVEPGEDK